MASFNDYSSVVRVSRGIKIPVAWGEIESFHHINYHVYFRYFESARTRYSEMLGLHKLMDNSGIGPIFGSTSCKYKFPLTHHDTVSVGAKIVGIKEDRFSMKYVVVSRRHNKIAAEGDGVGCDV